jgi:lipoprotein-anchoring transpeptidase ErfK/SrfK
MSRLIVSALLAGLAASAASAQPVLLQPGPYAAPPMVVVAPMQPSERLNLGGGFIEFLFGERGPSPVVVLPPQPDRDSQPIYINTAPDADPGLEQPPSMAIDPRYLRQEVAYAGNEEPGTIVIDTPQRFLFLVEPNGKAIRYGIGVGRPGFTWAGVHTVTAKREWPDWRPPDEMLKRQPNLPSFMAGGPNNPLGARALYLGSTLYRIHGSNEPWTIGHRVSSGCIRLRNEDVIDLYSRVKIGTKVVVI